VSAVCWDHAAHRRSAEAHAKPSGETLVTKPRFGRPIPSGSGVRPRGISNFRGWSDVQRRSIWCETDSGMTDDDKGDSLCDTSFNGIGYALQVEMLDEVTRAAWQDAEELENAAAKRPPRRTGVAE